jgi:hypothetical protein
MRMFSPRRERGEREREREREREEPRTENGPAIWAHSMPLCREGGHLILSEAWLLLSLPLLDGEQRELLCELKLATTQQPRTVAAMDEDFVADRSPRVRGQAARSWPWLPGYSSPHARHQQQEHANTQRRRHDPCLLPGAAGAATSQQGPSASRGARPR